MRFLHAAVLAAAVSSGGCAGDEESKNEGTSAGGAAGSGGASGAGGAAGSGGTPPLGPAVSKGPWVVASDGSSATLRWETAEPSVSPTVTLTPEGGGDPVVVDADFESFEVLNRYTAPLNPDAPPDEPGTYYMHEAKPAGLAAATCYTYSISHDPSAAGRFCTARSSGDSFKFLAIADTNPGLFDNTVSLLPHLIAEQFDFTLHAGDLQYYDSLFETWASWFPQMAPMLRQGTLFPSIGNHEVEKDDEQDQYYLRFFGGAGFDGTDAFYRYESGGVWFFTLNTEESVGIGTTQFSWFAEQLEDASKQPGYRFGVVYFHKPFLTCGDKSQKSAERAEYTPLFEQYGVRLVVQGHMHGYERFEVPLGADPNKSITYLTVGGGGGLLGNVDENDDRAECAMRVAKGRFYHGTIIEVGADGFSGRTIDRDGVVQDTFTNTL